MTFVGKILVILIMAFALVFLGVSTVVFSTATNWKTKADSTRAELTKNQSKVSDFENRFKDSEAKLATAKTEHQQALTEQENRIKELQSKVTDADAQATSARGSLEVAQKNAQIALAEATARKDETDTLNNTLNLTQDQANLFLKQNLDLTDRNRILEREKATAEQNARDLRSFKVKMMAWAQSKGLSTSEIEQFESTSVASRVEGRVVQVNSANKSMEISIGSNDGLATGQELFLFRLEPRNEYLGKVKIVAVYPNKGVADVITNRNVNLKKILEGDIVSSTLDAR